jgi:hypothetical protein
MLHPTTNDSNPRRPMTNEPRDQKPKIRLSQLSHGTG